jgi:hypothetical protein
MSKARDLAGAATALNAVTPTELGYLDGVTSAVQTQLNSKIGQANAINPSTVTTKGDILAATGSGTIVRQGVGSNGQVLTADSAEADGLKWATPAAAKNYTLLNSGGTSLNGLTTVTVSGLSGYDNLLVWVESAGKSGTRIQVEVRFNSDSNYNYFFRGSRMDKASSPFYLTGASYPAGTNSLVFGDNGSGGNTYINGAIWMDGCNGSGKKVGHLDQGIDGQAQYCQLSNATGYYDSSSVISSVSLISTAAFDNVGRIYVYGAI